jgi:hypothetical protein
MLKILNVIPELAAVKRILLKLTLTKKKSSLVFYYSYYIVAILL